MIIATADVLSGLSGVGNGSNEDRNHVKDVALWPEIRNPSKDGNEGVNS